MNNIYSFLRIAVLTSLLAVAMVCLISEPTSENSWYLVFFASKAVGVLAVYLFYRLINRWNKSELKKIARYCNEEDL